MQYDRVRQTACQRAACGPATSRGQRIGIKRELSRKALPGSGSCTVLASLLLPPSTMSPFPFADPPTKASLAEARAKATEQRSRVTALSDKIHAAEAELARLVQQSQCAIREMENERTAAEDHLAYTLDYLSPIRRLPDELLNQIFMLIFDDLPCCAWVLSAVSSSWRRRVLATPKLWSKVRRGSTQSLNFFS